MIKPAAMVDGVPVVIPSRNESAILKIRSISSISKSSIETMSYLGKRAIALRLPSADYHRVNPVDFVEAHVNALIRQRRDIFAHVIRAYRQLALPPIDQHRELDRIRPPQICQRRQGRAHGTARVKHIVNQDDVSAVDRKWNVSTNQPRIAVSASSVIAIR